MSDKPNVRPHVIEFSLSVDIVGNEIVLNGLSNLSPSLTPDAARETARLLIAAADQIER